jgi:signal transduction histidine kinase
MTGNFVLDWAMLAVSLCNTMLMTWLGLTLLLNAERRRWGVWLAGGGLLLGGVFFVSHSAILGYDMATLGPGLDFWWRVGWIPVILLPWAWYGVMLWYTGFWDDRQALLHHRHRLWLWVMSLLGVSFLGLMLFANPLPSFWQIIQGDLTARPAVGNVAVMVLAYPVYIVLCILLSVDALCHPVPSARVMGDAARRRARPWLMGTSGVLLLASLLVALAMAWVASTFHNFYVSPAALRDLRTLTLTIAGFDLAIATLIGVAVLLLGQAIVAYEVFTGRTLPRRGLFRHWRSAVILAAGYGATVSASFMFKQRPIYSLLLTTLLMVIFYALFSWRSYIERDRAMNYLRPFVASQRLYDHMLAPSVSDDSDMRTPFYALCRDVLETHVAYLIALGPLASFIGPPLVYPAGEPPAFPSLTDLVARFDSPQALGTPVAPVEYGGAIWVAPLWSERGLIGVLLLGEKRTGGLYTQEEIEIARASGERLIDTYAGAEMARRLMALQRQRLVESQVLDRQTHRMLHDDVLPNLHAAMLALSADAANADTVTLLAATHHQIADLLRDLRPATTTSEVAHLGLVGALRQLVDDTLGNAFDHVVWHIAPETETWMRGLPVLTAEVLFYAAREAIRNAAHHGRAAESSQLLNLSIALHDDQGDLVIVIEDNGAGMDAARASDAGSRQGLSLHSTMMAVIGGTLTVESTPGAYTRVTLSLPHAALQVMVPTPD